MEKRSVGPRIATEGSLIRSAARWAGTSCLALILLTLTAATAPASVTATLTFDVEDLSISSRSGYDLVSLADADYTTAISEPMLPAVTVQLLLPSGCVARSVSVECVDTVAVPGSYMISPVPRPAAFSSHEAAIAPQPNSETYMSRLPYPPKVARLVGDGTLAGHRIANVIVTPLRYVPATGELSLVTELHITVETAPGRALREPTGEAALRAVRRSVVNADRAPARVRTGGSATVRELIVTTPALAPAFQELADWKTRKGVPAEILTIDEILSEPAYSGVDTAEAIRNAITDYAENRGTEYVLLGGDTGQVPARLAHDFFYDQGIPCDLYYADLDGSWDADGDGRWGEIDDDAVDMFSDVFVGRAPVVDEADAALFVDKVLAYEGAPFDVVPDFQLEMVLLAEILWDDPDPYTDGGVALDMLVDDYVPNRFGPTTKLYERDGTLSKTVALAAIDAGCGIVAHEGHANIGRASIGPDNLVNADMDALANGARGGLFYSVGCWSAAIDHDTFAEHWLRSATGGGVAYVGNSRYGWGCPGYPGQCVSDLYSQQFMNSLFTKELAHAGLVHADAKHQYVGTAMTDDYMRYAMYELNLLGDPEMPIWTDTPVELDVQHDAEIESDGSPVDLAVSVTAGGGAVEDAVVCVMSIDRSIYEVVSTDASGLAVLSVDPGQQDDLLLTVTARNAVPYGASVGVVGTTGIVTPGSTGSRTALLPNYPNPFRDATSVAFEMAEPGRVTVAVYDVSGRLVRTLLDRHVAGGSTSVRWDGRDENGRQVASGTYFARMQTDGERFDRKVLLIR
ncbi:MAG: T9SS type A sorting domain-containing protein [Candidatus Eisenbacteria bacterium]|nr:T9SS type A sorting domain-containing protein [Candidatus Eisenbacteria bacterium]